LKSRSVPASAVGARPPDLATHTLSHRPHTHSKTNAHTNNQQQTKAKAIRKHVDKMIGLAKDGSLHARRQAAAFVYDKDIVAALFAEAPARYADRASGYCRVVTEPRVRRGDAAEMAAIELV
jgi:ribosomal protein L17